jgi:hypothetical protein
MLLPLTVGIVKSGAGELNVNSGFTKLGTCLFNLLCPFLLILLFIKNAKRAALIMKNTDTISTYSFF